MALNFVPCWQFEQAQNCKIDADHVFKISNCCGSTAIERKSDMVQRQVGKIRSISYLGQRRIPALRCDCVALRETCHRTTIVRYLPIIQTDWM
jgi:hypothetical protein